MVQVQNLIIQPLCSALQFVVTYVLFCTIIQDVALEHKNSPLQVSG